MIDLDKEILKLERDLIERALAETGGVKMRAAKLLNISFRSLRYRLEKHGFDNPPVKCPSCHGSFGGGNCEYCL